MNNYSCVSQRPQRWYANLNISVETIPAFVGCSTVYAVMGTTVSCKFNSSDDVYLVSNTTEAEIDRFSSTISYVQETDEPVDIR